MPRIAFGTRGETPFERLLGHRPAILRRWRALELAFHATTGLEAELREEVRRTLAYRNGCRYCMAKGRPTEAPEDPRVLLATAYAQLAAGDPPVVDDLSFDLLRKQFTDPELAELTAFICFTSAAQRFGALLQLEPESPADDQQLPCWPNS